jgi:hypothetical protein
MRSSSIGALLRAHFLHAKTISIQGVADPATRSTTKIQSRDPRIERLRVESYFLRGTIRAFHSCAFISTRRPRNRTPSASSRNRCSIAESPVNLIAPPAPNTRCHGNPNPRRKIAATCRAAPGNPAARAIPPYVETFPRGIPRIARSIRRRIVPESFCLVLPKIRTRVGRVTSGAPPFSRSLREGGDFDFTPPCETLPAPHTPSCAPQTRSRVWSPASGLPRACSNSPA